MKKLLLLFIVALSCATTAWAQQKVVSGRVVSSTDGEPVIGAAVVVKGTTNGTVTDFDGRYSISVGESDILLMQCLGFERQEVPVAGQSTINITLVEESLVLENIVVVGYGQQKKASVVGAITQTTGEVLQRAAGISDVGAALTGNLPGVITTQSTGMPGEEEPQIVIRGSSSWNNSDPLVLVDGIERPMSSVDVGSVQSISVLKDASATAVFGVKGANGVILITTKRGAEGKAQIDVSASATMKRASKLPEKYDSYDALKYRNEVIEHELPISSGSWSDITPQETIDQYRNQTTVEQRERYPNVDWQKELFKDYAMSYNANINVSGGTKFVKYFASADFQNEGDLFRIWDNGRGYESGYGYNRINVRSNLDFQLTKSTVFKVNLAGSTAFRKKPWGQTDDTSWSTAQQWAGAYNIAPDVFLPKYSDGSWGYATRGSNITNSAANLALSGTMTTTTTRINTDFTLEQDLSFLTDGLSVKGLVSWDNAFQEYNRGVNDLYNDALYKWIDPETGIAYYSKDYDNNNKFDFAESVLWTTSGGEVQNWSTMRNLYYQFILNYARDFGRHSVTGMGMFSRSENATGSEIPHYREDWAFRVTYDFADRYFLEYNGAYNGSEKFSSENRFAFFNSGAVGWMISDERFMAPLTFMLDMLKVRASYGEIGDDNVNQRWLYMSQWEYKGFTSMDQNAGESPYKWYSETAVGNPDVHWETVRKFNFGIDYSFLGGLVAGNVEIFRDKRFDILVPGSERSVPSYFGATPVTANLGKVKTKGYEIEVRLNKVFKNDMRVWANLNMTHAENEVIIKDDPKLLPSYQKDQGYAIGQTTAYIDDGFCLNYDDLYGSPAHDTNDSQKLPGDYYIIDFNADGIIDSDDAAPYGYSSIPQNTYNATVGFDWKGFSCFAQFYGVNNVTRDVTLQSFSSNQNNVYDCGTFWSPERGQNADMTMPRWNSTPSYNTGTQYLYDGSYVRLKNVELAYTWNKGWISKIGFKTLKVYLNGNNLWVWSKMPDDRESNYAGASYTGAYPTMKRYTFGLKFTL